MHISNIFNFWTKVHMTIGIRPQSQDPQLSAWKKNVHNVSCKTFELLKDKK